VEGFRRFLARHRKGLTVETEAFKALT